MTRKLNLPLLLVTVFAPLSLAAPAAAQAHKGDKEIQLSASAHMNPRQPSSASGDIFVNFGKFTSDLIQVGGGPTISISEGDGAIGIDARLGGNVFVRRYFGVTKVQPYIGGEYFMQDVSNPDFSYANAIFGVKNYLSARAALDFKGGYGFGLKSVTEGLVQFRVGLTVLF